MRTGENRRKSKETKKNPNKKKGEEQSRKGKGGRGQSQQGRAQRWALPILICVWPLTSGVVGLRSVPKISFHVGSTATKAPFFIAFLILMVVEVLFLYCHNDTSTVRALAMYSSIFQIQIVSHLNQRHGLKIKIYLIVFVKI
jgi:hypothetical protein